jgi:hypothetical protein
MYVKSLRTLSALTLAALILFSCCRCRAQTPSTASEKVLVPATSWVYPALGYMQKWKMLLGYPRGYFDGKRSLSRKDGALAVRRIVYSVPGIVTPVDTTAQGDPGGYTAEQLKSLRELFLEFKPEITIEGKSWKEVDDLLLKLQDLILQPIDRERAPEHKPTDRIDADDWEYDALKHLSDKKLVDQIPAGQLLTWEQLAKIVASGYSRRRASEIDTATLKKADTLFKYDLGDIAQLRDLARACRPELTRLGINAKAADARFKSALDKRIRQEEDVAAAILKMGDRR